MENAVVDDGRNRHGFPQGYHFEPNDDELMHLLDEQLAGHKLPYPLPNIFHHVRIRDFHPAHLYEGYKEHKEADCIYFFDHREYRTAGRRPARATMDGGWKASGGGKPMIRDNVVVGSKLTMVFYEKDEHTGKPDRKTVWALNEYTTLVGPDKKVADLALYRLYKKKEASASTRQAQGHARAAQPHYHDHQYYAHGGAPASAPGPSNWVMPAPTLPPPTAHDLEVSGHSSCPEYTDSNDDEPLPAPAAGGYLADEFEVWCETKQEDPPAASPCYDDLPMLMDESKLHCKFEELTFQELLTMSMPEDTNMDDAAAPATSMPDDANKDDMAAPDTSMPDNANKDDMAAPDTSMPDDANKDDMAAPDTAMPDDANKDDMAAPDTVMPDANKDDMGAPATSMPNADQDDNHQD